MLNYKRILKKALASFSFYKLFLKLSVTFSVLKALPFCNRNQIMNKKEKFIELYKLNSEPLERYALNLTRNRIDAEELCAEK